MRPSSQKGGRVQNDKYCIYYVSFGGGPPRLVSRIFPCMQQTRHDAGLVRQQRFFLLATVIHACREPLLL